MEENKKKDSYPMHLGASPEIYKYASLLRRRMTSAEKLLWEELRNNQLEGYKFRNQHPVLKFILDFYCHSEKVGLEVDGDSHFDKVQKLYDKDRSAILKEYGIRILRIRNEDIIHNIENVKLKIIEFIKVKSL